eukprot:gene9432-11099_t
MIYQIVAVVALCSALAQAGKVEGNSTLGICGYEDTCSAGGYAGVCVSIGGGCCPGGTVTSGLCPGSSDIKCCTAPSCSTPSGSGSCLSTSQCSGTPVAGYCAGPSDVQCCVGGGGGGSTLGQQIGATCDTDVALGLANQITSVLNSWGYSFKQVDSNWIHCSGNCVLQSAAADSLASAAAAVNDYITLNSAFRTSAEQYLLYKWYQQGRCDISLAASPGSSNHEGGRAIDTSYYNYWVGPLSNYGWVHSYPSSDPVHFDYNGSPDISQVTLKAFQALWNSHNPGSQLDEDGIYGPATENALYNSPCNGW